MMMTKTAILPIPRKRGRKYDDVTRGARQVFVEMGYERANMDEVARGRVCRRPRFIPIFPTSARCSSKSTGPRYWGWPNPQLNSCALMSRRMSRESRCAPSGGMGDIRFRAGDVSYLRA